MYENNYENEIKEAHYYMRITAEVIGIILGSILAIMILIKMGNIMFYKRPTLEPIDWSQYQQEKLSDCEITQDKVTGMCCNGFNCSVKNVEVDKETGCITKVECGR